MKRVCESPIGVIGAGTIGSGLALCCLLAGYQVNMIDSDQAMLDRARQFIDGHLGKLFQKGKLTADQVDTCMNNLVTFQVPRGDFLVPVGHCDFVIEAVYDSLPVKCEVYSNITRFATNPNMVILSTTSAITATMLNAYGGKAPVVVAHPFWPSWRQRSVEVARAAGHTDAADRVSEFLRSIGKVPLPCKDVWGFAGNRIFCQYADAARTVGLAQGLTVEQVDHITRQQLGGGGIFTALDGTGSGSPKGTRLAVEVLQGISSHLSMPWLAPHDAFAAQNELWLPNGRQDIEVDIGTTLLFERAMWANLLAVTLGLLHEGVMSPGDLDFMSKDALGFKYGLVAWMQALGEERVWQYFASEHRLPPVPPTEAFAKVEAADLDAYYQSLADRGIT